LPENICLLAPVNEEHLRAAIDECRDGIVAFGSDVWPFPDIPEGARVIIYASHDELRRGPHRHATWEATFLRRVDAGGAGMYLGQGCRPSTTRTDTGFLGFYEVRGLRELEEGEWVSVDTLARKDGSIRANWPPRRPYAIPCP
jgi:hypothetical protein